MKKAKIILTTIAVFSVIGGVLAFKVGGRVYYASNKPKGPCNVKVTLPYVITTPPAGFDAYLSTAPTTTACPVLRVTIPKSK